MQTKYINSFKMAIKSIKYVYTESEMDKPCIKKIIKEVLKTLKEKLEKSSIHGNEQLL